MQRFTFFLLGLNLFFPLITPVVAYSATLPSTTYLPSSDSSDSSSTTSSNFSLSSFLPSLTSLPSILQGDLPLNINLETGALGLPNVKNYFSNFSQLRNTIPTSTQLDSSNTTLFDLLSSIDSSDSELLLDIALDGNILYTQDNGNNYETVVTPSNLEDRYYQLTLSEIATQAAEELGFSAESQSAIDHILDLAQDSETSSVEQANNSETIALDSENKGNNLSTYTEDIANLSDSSQFLADDSLLTDTSFQILRNISQQLGIQARQNNRQAEQTQAIGQILANSSQQLTQQSKQFQEQQSTAKHLLETAKKQQVLDSFQVTTNGQQLKLLTQASTEQNRLDNAAFQHAQQGAGMILIPMAPQGN